MHRASLNQNNFKMKLQNTLLSLSAVLFSAPCGAQAQSYPADVNNKDLPNFHTVHPYLLRSGEPSAAGMQELSKRGVKTLIDLRARGERSKSEEAQAKALNMQYINLPMSDKAPTEAQVNTLMETIKKGKAANAPVLVHCAHGSDRTGCMVGIWRVSEDGLSYDQAYKEMRKYYFGPQYKQLSAAVKSRATK